MSDTPTTPGTEPTGATPPEGVEPPTGGQPPVPEPPAPEVPPAPPVPPAPVAPPVPAFPAPPAPGAPSTQPPAPTYGAATPPPPPGYGAAPTPPPAPGYGAGATPPPAPGYGAAPTPAPGYGAGATPPPAPGYGTPEAPTYGAAPQQPAYGAASYGSPATGPYAPVPEKTNGMAIASLVSSIAGWFCGITTIVGIILGIVSLNQIKKTDGKGKGLAVAGIIVGGIGLVGWIIGSIFFAFAAAKGVSALASALPSFSMSADPESSSTPSDTASEDPNATDKPIPSDFSLPQTYVAGDCFSTLSQYYDMSDTARADCGQPHGMEILYTFSFPAAVTSPSDPAIQSSGEKCYSQMQTMVSADLVNASDVDIYYPSANQWNAGHLTAYCVLIPTDQNALLSGSVVAGSYTGTAGN